MPMLDTNLKPYIRLKLLGGKAKRKAEKKPRKYAQPKNTMNRIYFPTNANWIEIFSNTKTEIHIVESELAAVLMCHIGFPAIALGGITAGTPDKGARLHPDLMLVDWMGRPVRIWPDYDVLHTQNKNNHSRVYLTRLEDRLLDEGVKKIEVVDIKAVDGNPNTGPDDYYIHHKAKKNLTTVDAKAKKMLFSLPTIIRITDVRTTEEQQANPPPPTETLIPGFLNKELTIVSGNPKVGKTRFMTMVNGALSVGEDVFGYFKVDKDIEDQGGIRVGHIYSEDGESVAEKRFDELSDYELALIDRNNASSKFTNQKAITRNELRKLRAKARKRYRNKNFIVAYKETAQRIVDQGPEGVRKFIRRWVLKSLTLDMHDDFRGSCPKDLSQGEYDKYWTSALKQIGREEGCAIILTNHNTKSQHVHQHMSAGGTKEFLGGAENLITMIEPQLGSEHINVQTKGRTVSTQNYAGRINNDYGEHGAFVVDGSWEDVLTQVKRGEDYTDILTQHPEGMTGIEIHKALLEKYKNNPQQLSQLNKNTTISKVRRKALDGAILHKDKKYWRDLEQYEAFKIKGSS